MPQSVLAYRNGKDFEASDIAKRRILKLYREDVTKFAEGYEDKVFAVFDGIPGQLSKKDKKYTDNELYRTILFDKLNINEGMLMENIVAQMLRNGRSRLYFYSRSDNRNRENHMAIDFLITDGKKIAPVEVKSGNYRSHSSLDKFRKHFSSVIGNSYILYTKDVMI